MVPGMETRAIGEEKPPRRLATRRGLLKLAVSRVAAFTPAKYRNYVHYSLRRLRDWCADSIMEIQDEWDNNDPAVRLYL